jgi:DNA-binding MarR family transcriptional regulator
MAYGGEPESASAADPDPDPAPPGSPAPPGELSSRGNLAPPGELSSRGEAATLLGAISAVRRTARRAVRHAWRSEPLPPAQGELLRLIASRPGISVADAAQELRLAPNTVSTLVGRLAEQDLLSRERAQPDGRSVRLAVTKKARQRIAEWQDLRAQLASRALAELAPADRRALADAVPAMLRLAERMEAR